MTAARANQNEESASVASTEVSCQVRASSFFFVPAALVQTYSLLFLCYFL